MNEYPSYDIDSVAEEFLIDIAELAALYKLYIDEVEEALIESKDLAIKNDMNLLERTIHKIKGVSGNLRINNIYEQTKSFDIMLRQNTCTDPMKNIEELEEEFKKAKEAIILIFKEKGIDI